MVAETAPLVTSLVTKAVAAVGTVQGTAAATLALPPRTAASLALPPWTAAATVAPVPAPAYPVAPALLHIGLPDGVPVCLPRLQVPDVPATAAATAVAAGGSDDGLEGDDVAEGTDVGVAGQGQGTLKDTLNINIVEIITISIFLSIILSKYNFRGILI